MPIKSRYTGTKLTKAQETVDREFGKEYSQWTSGGADKAKNEIEKLRLVAAGLRSGNVTTGGLTGFFPDRMTSNEVLSARADVNSTVMNRLRAILGAQFTEKEGERIIKNTWNEADSTQNNLVRLERLIQDLEAQAIAKDQKARYYENFGTLQGFKSGSNVAVREQRITPARGSAPRGSGGSFGMTEARAREASPIFKTNQIEWAD